MIRILSLACAAALMGSTAQAQSILPTDRITGPVRNRGVFSLANGTWQPINPASAASSNVLFNNTSPTGYFFGGAAANFGLVDHGRIPSTSSPGITGTADAYTVDCYQFAYCSGDLNPVSQVSVFFEQYSPCSDVDAPGSNAVAGFIATGLPSGSSTGAVNCWILSFDLSNTTLTFSLAGDATRSFDGNANTDSFGWLASYPTNTAAQTIGPLITGNCSGTGGFVSNPPRGLGTAFAGTPGASNATGLGTNDFFWIDDNAGLLGLNANGGCFFFGGCNNAIGAAGNPWGGFWLQLFGEDEDRSIGTSFCSSLVNASGGAAIITVDGTDPNEDLVFTSSPVPNTLGQFFYGPMMLTGAQSLGDGLRCVGGMTTRMLPLLTAGMMMQLPNSAVFTVDYAAPYATGFGPTSYFQHWFRSAMVTGTGSNTSNGICVRFF